MKSAPASDGSEWEPSGAAGTLDNAGQAMIGRSANCFGPNAALASLIAEGPMDVQLAQTSSPIFAAQAPHEDDDTPFDVPSLPYSTQEGPSNAAAPDGSHSEPSEAGADFIAADSVFLDY